MGTRIDMHFSSTITLSRLAFVALLCLSAIATAEDKPASPAVAPRIVAPPHVAKRISEEVVKHLHVEQLQKDEIIGEEQATPQSALLEMQFIQEDPFPDDASMNDVKQEAAAEAAATQKDVLLLQRGMEIAKFQTEHKVIQM